MKDTDLGVFLHRTSYSDSSLIVWFFTRKNGLQKFIFKGGKKKAHSIFPMSISELTYFGKANSDLLNLMSAESTTPHQLIFDPIRTTIAFFMAETIRKCAHQGDKDEKLFAFLERKIDALNGQDDLSLFPLKFLVEASEVFGFMPLSEGESALFFNIDEGVFQRDQSEEGRTEQGEGVDLIHAIINNDTGARHNRSTREDAFKMMIVYYRTHVPGFNSLESYEIVKEILHA